MRTRVRYYYNITVCDLHGVTVCRRYAVDLSVGKTRTRTPGYDCAGVALGVRLRENI